MSSALVEMRVLTIDRTRWYRGQGDRESRLLRSKDGKMCCLGFDALACGLEEKNIIDVGFPSQVMAPPRGSVGDPLHAPVKLPKEMRWLLEVEAATGIKDGVTVFDTEVERNIGFINDDHEINEVTRERLLSVEFAKRNVKLVFIN